MMISSNDSMKHSLPITSTDDGISIVFKEQRAKQQSSIIAKCESLSNVTVSSLSRAPKGCIPGRDSSLLLAKQELPKTVTYRGMQIVLRKQFKKHEWSMIFSRDSSSKVNLLIVPCAKHLGPRISRELGM
jgi:hypothetical protein